MAVKPMTLADLMADLDGYRERIPLRELVARLETVEISPDDVQPFARFGKETYQRNLMHAGPAYQALVLCWRPGQRSPIHDHRGSSCGVKIIQGVATETFFERTQEGYVYPTSTRQLARGAVCGSQDDDMHQVSNLEPHGHDLITLHIYSPPLLAMGVYSLHDPRVGEFRDPVVGLLDGAGI